MAEPTPLEDLVINDRYWLSWIRANLDKANEARTTAAEKLTTAFGWLWTVYSATAVLSVALTDRHLSGARTVVILFPVLPLIAGYLLSTLAMMPPNLKVDPRVPTEIRSAYKQSLDIRRQRLRNAGIVAAVAALGVLTAATAVATAPPVSAQEFHAVLDAENDQILVTGRFDKNQEVSVRATEPDGQEGDQTLLVADSHGRLDGELAAPGASEIVVTATWATESDERQVTITLER